MRVRKKKNWLQRKEASVRRGSGRVFFLKIGVFGSLEGEERRG